MSTSTHFFRLDPDAFRCVTLGQQNALVVSRELQVEVGDQIVGRECRSPTVFTGAWLCRRVTHLGLGLPGILDGFVVVSLNSAVENEWATGQLKRKLSLAERQGLSPDRYWRLEERRHQARRGVLRASSLPVDAQSEDESA